MPSPIITIAAAGIYLGVQLNQGEISDSTRIDTATAWIMKRYGYITYHALIKREQQRSERLLEQSVRRKKKNKKVNKKVNQ